MLSASGVFFTIVTNHFVLIIHNLIQFLTMGNPLMGKRNCGNLMRGISI